MIRAGGEDEHEVAELHVGRDRADRIHAVLFQLRRFLFGESVLVLDAPRLRHAEPVEPDEDLPLAAAEQRAAAIEALASVSIEATAGEEGKLFGSVGTRDISEAITAAGVEIDKSEVRLPEGVIRELGEYEVMLQLHGNVAASIAVAVVAA